MKVFHLGVFHADWRNIDFMLRVLPFSDLCHSLTFEPKLWLQSNKYLVVGVLPYLFKLLRKIKVNNLLYGKDCSKYLDMVLGWEHCVVPPYHYLIWPCTLNRKKSYSFKLNLGCNVSISGLQQSCLNTPILWNSNWQISQSFSKPIFWIKVKPM